MKYRLIFIFLLSLLFASFSFNCLHYDAMIRAESTARFNDNFYPKLIQGLHNRIYELEQ